MIRKTRREFIRDAAVIGGGLAFGPRILFGADGEALPCDLAIARNGGETAKDPSALAGRLTEAALAALGGMSRFVSKGDVVWVKPNIGWNRAPALAANTNPQVVATLVRLCLGAGAKQVKVGDNPCHPPAQTYATSGIAAAVKEAGGKMVILEERRFKDVQLGGERLKSWPLYPEIIDCDLVINVPVVKHHSLSTASLCMKNYMGVIGGNRGKWHQDIPTCLVDITRYMKPRLSVLDAVRTLTAHGPQGGNPADVKQLETVAAGVDIVALDALGAELLGHEPPRLDTVRAGHEAGLGTMDYRATNLQEVAVS